MKYYLLLILTLPGLFLGSSMAGPATASILDILSDDEGGIPAGTLSNNGFYGISVENIGDLDLDGVDDIAVGELNYPAASGARSAVYIKFMNADGTVKSFVRIADGEGGLPLGTFTTDSLSDEFGGSLSLIDDLDGDGIPELAVGNAKERSVGNRKGSVFILFLKRDGTVRDFTKIADGVGGLPASTLLDIDEFGSSIASLGDIDGDGNPEIAVGAIGDDTGGSVSGALYILTLAADGTVVSQTKIADGQSGMTADSIADGSAFGDSVENVGDFDKDGIPDLMVGAALDNTGGTSTGAIYLLLLNSDKTVKSHLKIADGLGGIPSTSLQDGGRFGASIAQVGDLNGDGIPETAVGATDDDTGGSSQGALYILFHTDTGEVSSIEKIADSTGGLPAFSQSSSLNFGTSIASLGDLNKDGTSEIAVGATGYDDGGMNFPGAVYLLSLGDLPIIVTTLEDELDATSTDGTGVSLREAVRDAKATGEFRKITFSPTLDGGTIVLDGTQIDITEQDLTITGSGLENGISISGNDQSRIFFLYDSNVTFECLELKDGNVSSSSGGAIAVTGLMGRTVLDRVYIHDCTASTPGAGGGAVLCNLPGLITNSTFLNNRASHGGAILTTSANSDVVIENSTFVGNMSVNTVSANGAAISNLIDGTTTVKRCTFISNTAEIVPSYTVYSASGPIHVENCAFADSETSVGVQSVGTFTETNNFDLSLSDFAPFGDYGGKTLTQPLLASSSAKDMATFTPLPATEQRGSARQRGAGIDPGATETLDPVDFQPDNLIGKRYNRQKGNNRYNNSGAGQKVKVRLKRLRKAKTFFTVQNDGIYTDTITLRGTKPDRRTLELKVFSLTGTRKNVTGAVTRRSLVLPNLAPGQGEIFRADYKRKSRDKKARGKILFTSTSALLGQKDTVKAKLKTLRE